MKASDVLALAEVRRMAKDGRARAARLAAGLTLEEIAGPCRVTLGAVHHWETGQRVPRGRAALRYARLLEDLERAAEGAAS